MKRFTKKEHIIVHLIQRGQISSWEAIASYRHTRLSTVIHELRRAGASIKTVDEPHVGGTHARYLVLDRDSVLNTLTPPMRERIEFLMTSANDGTY